MIRLGIIIFLFLLSIPVYSQLNLSAFWKTTNNCECPDGSKVSRGAACSGGGLCVGTFLGNNYMVTPGGCTDSATPVCNDGADVALGRAWDANTPIEGSDLPGVEGISLSSTASTVLGDVNTAAIVGNVAVATDSFAHYCSNMNYGGYTDWYLPSKSELVFLFCNSVNAVSLTSRPPEYPGCGGDYGKSTAIKQFSGLYFSSTEHSVNIDDAWALSGSTGAQTSYNKRTAYAGTHVRCIRRY